MFIGFRLTKRLGVGVGAHLGEVVFMSRPPYVQMAVRVPRELKDWLEQVAAREGLHASELTRLLLHEGLARRAAINGRGSSRSGG